MIGRQHQEQWIFALGGGSQRRNGDRRRGIATDRFEQNAAFQADLAQLFGHDKAVVFVAYHQRCGQRRYAIQPRQRFLQHALIRDQWQKLLGIKAAR